MRVRKGPVALAAIAAAATSGCSVGGLGPATRADRSASTPPCGKPVIADWYGDGRIDRRYPRRCYRDALRLLPADADAPWELRRELRERARAG